MPTCTGARTFRLNSSVLAQLFNQLTTLLLYRRGLAKYHCIGLFAILQKTTSYRTNEMFGRRFIYFAITAVLSGHLACIK